MSAANAASRLFISTDTLVLILCRRYEGESCRRLGVPHAPSAAVQRAVGICDGIADQLRWRGGEAHGDCAGGDEDETSLIDPSLLSLLHDPGPSLTPSSFNELWQRTAHVAAKIDGEVSEAALSHSSTLVQQLSSSLVIASKQNEEDCLADLQGNEEAPFEDLEKALRLATMPFPDLKARTHQSSCFPRTPRTRCNPDMQRRRLEEDERMALKEIRAEQAS